MRDATILNSTLIGEHVLVPFVSCDLTPSQRLALILDGLRKAAAAKAGRQWALGPIVLILWPYLHRVGARFDALCARILRGRVRPPSAPRARPAAGDLMDPPAKLPRKPRLPQTRGWLASLGPDLAVYGSQLRYLLGDPQMHALMESSPQMGRVLRPLCRMLRIEPGADLPPSLYPAKPAPARSAPVKSAPVKSAPGRTAKPKPLRVGQRARGVDPSRPRPRVDPANWWLPKRA